MQEFMEQMKGQMPGTNESYPQSNTIVLYFFAFEIGDTNDAATEYLNKVKSMFDGLEFKVDDLNGKFYFGGR